MWTANELEDEITWGVLLAIAGDPPAFIEPNWMLLPPACFPATGPPFGMYPEAPAALIVTDDLRLWSLTPEVGLKAVFPLIMVGVPTDGTAGGMIPLPLRESSLPCCDPAEPPTAVDEDDVFDAVGENGFLDTLA